MNNVSQVARESISNADRAQRLPRQLETLGEAVLRRPKRPDFIRTAGGADCLSTSSREAGSTMVLKVRIAASARGRIDDCGFTGLWTDRQRAALDF